MQMVDSEWKSIGNATRPIHKHINGYPRRLAVR